MWPWIEAYFIHSLFTWFFRSHRTEFTASPGDSMITNIFHFMSTWKKRDNWSHWWTRLQTTCEVIDKSIDQPCSEHHLTDWLQLQCWVPMNSVAMFVQNIRIHNNSIQQMKKQPVPPSLRLTIVLVARFQLVIPINTPHVSVVLGDRSWTLDIACAAIWILSWNWDDTGWVSIGDNVNWSFVDPHKCCQVALVTHTGLTSSQWLDVVLLSQLLWKSSSVCSVGTTRRYSFLL